MNILYVLHTTAIGNGATTAFLALLKGLMAKGVKPYVAVPDKDGIYSLLTKQNIDVLATPYRMNTYPYHKTTKEKALFLPRLISKVVLSHIASRKIAEHVKDKHIQIVHSNVSVLSVGYEVAKILQVPHIFHIREYADKINLHYIPSKRSLIKRLNTTDNYNVFITKDLQKYYKLDKSPRSIFSYDGREKANKELQIKQKKNYFLFVGRIQEAKGLDMLIDAYKQYKSMSNHPFPLLIAGNIASKGYYQSIIESIERYGIKDNITFLGQRSDVDSLMSEAKAFISVTPYEGFGLTFMEASLNGCLIIGRYTTGIKEQIDNGKELEGGDIALHFNTSKELAMYMFTVETTPFSSFVPMIVRSYKATSSQLYNQKKNIDKIWAFYEFISSQSNK